ncbi:MAG: hypothetical protein EPN74_16685 [Rhodanobacter sp.]|nr:MAG: hypothetical protein EPN74_16685 [Rhodanobacter sp.]
MRILKLIDAAIVFGIVAIGAGSYSPVASATTSCYKVNVCVNGSCQLYIVCDDGTMYISGKAAG